MFVFISKSFGQQTNNVDFLRCKAEISILPKAKEVRGNVIYEFKILKDVDSIYLDAKSFSHAQSALNSSERIFHKFTDKHIIYNYPFKKGNKYKINLGYITYPKKALYFIDWEHPNHPEANPQIWTQGQGKYTSNWLPSIDDMNDKIEFDLSVSFHKNYDVIANGKLISKKKKNDSILTWQYDMQKPMSSYLVALAIGNYNKKVEKSASGIPLEMYYYPKDSVKFESTYRYSKQMFDFLEEEIGVPYPWKNYKQVPVKDFLYAGMENTSLTIFSDAFVVNDTAFIDKNYVNVNAHELAHQWFGDLVTETHGTHHWLHEGFATYYALLAEKKLFGEKHYQHKLYEYSQEIINAQEKDTIPLMNPKASSLTFYKKGAWALHSLRDLVGDEVFKNSVKKYLKNYQYKNVETEDFLSIIEETKRVNLNNFRQDWLLSTEFPQSALIKLIEENEDIGFLETHKTNEYLRYRTNNNDSIIVSSLITQLPKGNYRVKNVVLGESLIKKDYPTSMDLIKEGFKSELKTRQYIANSMREIPHDLKGKYESLLNDTSYQTIENALYNLWVNFPDDREKYLNQTKNIIGFNNRNIRTLWLALALNTEGFQKGDYNKFYKELENYTHPAFHFEVRRNAFQYLNELELISSITLKNLYQASTHHNWRFRSFCKKLLNQITQENK
ncbi:M1 family metallopeptidase [Pseudofulvibacter geojedonensis]|uniref:Aminopeptidase N n=2 Tax=Pseudofulvibacter geojedonensis TaxID=1123758 RepID=A0ABW3I3I5_9FLAO